MEIWSTCYKSPIRVFKDISMQCCGIKLQQLDYPCITHPTRLGPSADYCSSMFHLPSNPQCPNPVFAVVVRIAHRLPHCAHIPLYNVKLMIMAAGISKVLYQATKQQKIFLSLEKIMALKSRFMSFLGKSDVSNETYVRKMFAGFLILLEIPCAFQARLYVFRPTLCLCLLPRPIYNILDQKIRFKCGLGVPSYQHC